MTRRTYDCDEISLSHSDVVQLRQAGDLNLGIDDDVAARIGNIVGMGPTKTTASTAFNFWNWIAIGWLAYSIYLSFTVAWWWFIPGFIGMQVIYGANKKASSQNYLDAAMVDREFYERVLENKGWLYQMEEEVASQYLI